ncbi:RNA-guided endonuclease InsQ/TnpB family protein [Allosalinactinospora lopnorensis]|uniref:RNA-guided endonuclease InsQ/TnpB family protein n=1 Tax=Allosalinactinospora lopnorensis TaxID=1352348 RepID=UPI000A732D11|nr:transposase [Allosalinactinospora lopnorensis]
MSRFGLRPTREREAQLFEHCAQARHAWNLAWRVTDTYRKGGARAARPPRYVGMAALLTEVRRTATTGMSPEEADYFAWVASGNAEIQQQALRDFDQALPNFLGGTHGYPKRRKKHRHEGLRVIGAGRVPAFTPDGEPVLNATGKQVHHRRVVVQKLNTKWAQVKVPGCGWVRFRNTRRGLPDAKSYRVTYRHGQWHISFAVVPDPTPAPGDGSVVGVDRGVAITAALSTGKTLNCPPSSKKELAKRRKHERRAARAPKNSPRKAAEHAKANRLKRREADRRKDWVEKTSTRLARSFDVIRFEGLRIKNMTASAKGTGEEPGRNVGQKAGLNRMILAQGWGMLRTRTEHKAPGRVEDVPPAYTSLRCSLCGWIDKNSRKSQAEFVCSFCGFTCNADTNASMNVAAGHAGGTTPPRRSSVREPQPAWVGIPLFIRGGGCQSRAAHGRQRRHARPLPQPASAELSCVGLIGDSEVTHQRVLRRDCAGRSWLRGTFGWGTSSDPAVVC